MVTQLKTNESKNYEFTVKRISILQNLLSQAEKRTVNQFIDEIRRTVYFYHSHMKNCKTNPSIQGQDAFFTRLNDKAHQLARFTTELSNLVHDAPADLFKEANKADRAIDSIHGNLVNLCLTIDDLLNQKDRFVIDITTTVQTIYEVYSRVFEVVPNGRAYADEADIPFNAPLEDLLVPVVQVLVEKDLERCFKLVQTTIEHSK